MTLKEFILQFDTQEAIVLLEGKRNVLEEDKERLVLLGTILASNTTKMMFRSGNAEGADYFFSMGIAAVDKSRLHVITPYTGHRKKLEPSYESISLDDINLANQPDIVYQSKSNRKMEKLIDQYVAGERNRFSIKAAYILRDTVKALGTDNIKPATFGIFYDDRANPRTGGTGHTMNICLMNDIPIIDQSVWMVWVED
jgi:hypothetical protein